MRCRPLTNQRVFFRFQQMEVHGQKRNAHLHCIALHSLLFSQSSLIPSKSIVITMSESQAELLRKRREARQKKILASGESRLSKITGTTGTNAQVAPSPSVLLAREQLWKKEQEEERIKAAVASGELLESDMPTGKNFKPDPHLFILHQK